MQGQRHLVLKLMVGIGIVLDVEAQRLIGCHHGQRFVVHVAGNLVAGHLRDNLVAECRILTQ